MRLIRTVEAMEAWTAQAQGRLGLVPTMGALHAGHASLMALLRPRVDRLIVSVFVNPLQFGPGEDLERYPRDLAHDAALCEEQGVDLLFAPDSLYPEGFCTSVRVEGLTDVLCGASRPGHFDGVCTVVARLFGLTRCHVACFGEKDYQQLAVIRRMVRDLALPVEIVGAPLVRDADGLALSSRNRYLSADERRRAASLYRALCRIREGVEAGRTEVADLRHEALRLLDVDRLDYLEVVDAADLRPLGRIDRPARALVAAHVGATRLIDNVALLPR